MQDKEYNDAPHVFSTHAPFWWWCKVKKYFKYWCSFFSEKCLRKSFFPNIHTLISLKFEWIRPKVKVIIQANVSFQTFLFQITLSKTAKLLANLSSTLCEKLGLRIVRFQMSEFFRESVPEKNLHAGSKVTQSSEIRGLCLIVWWK